MSGSNTDYDIEIEEETDEFQEKFREIISQEDQTTTAQSYEDIREIVRVEMINQIIFK